MKTKLPEVLRKALLATFTLFVSGVSYSGTIDGTATEISTNQTSSETLTITNGGTLALTQGAEYDMTSAGTFQILSGGKLSVTNGTFKGGSNNFWLYEGEVTVTGSHSVAEVCRGLSSQNYRVLVGLGSTAANINVSDGGTFKSSASQFVSNYFSNSTVNINVDGQGSSFTQTAETVKQLYYPIGSSGQWKWHDQTYRDNGDVLRYGGYYDKESTLGSSKKDQGVGDTITYLCDSGTDKSGCHYSAVNNCTTNISVSNGGLVDFQSGVTYVGSFLDRINQCDNKQLNLTIDQHSTLSFNRLEIYANTNITNDGGSILVNGDMSLYTGCTLTINLTAANASKEVITLNNGAMVSVKNWQSSIIDAASTRAANGTVTINIIGAQNMTAGSSFILFNTEQDLTGANVNISGTEAEITTENGQTVITLLEDLFVARDPLADVLGAAAWGVQKSSQAFTGTLWGGRTNAVVLNTCTSTSSDEKGNVVSTTQPTGRTMAWGTAYGQFSEIDSCCDAAGTDYNIYGAAIGAEHQFASGRSIGAALGYDWGKVSPFHGASFDQESKHAAIYGRAGQWKLGTQGALAVDLSAAVGQTESELPVGDVEQDSLQLDARVSYIYALTDKTSISAFAGLQYYAQSDDSTANVEVGSAQYLRSLAGVGINHAVTAQTTVFAEASVYNDAMRHNPEVMVDGFTYGVANPGRLGGSITAGAAYELNANWTLRGSYSFDAAKHSTEHSVNAGAVYKF